MDCKENFDLLDLNNCSQQIPSISLNDELMSKVSFENQLTPQTNFDILLNKHLNNHEITDIQLQQLPEDQRNILALIQNKCKQKKKRTDQSQKLFYKRAFKYSQQKFFKRCKNRSRKMSHFYHYHFDSVSVKQGVPITHFYHPDKKTKPGLSINHKTFNGKYVKLLMKSKSFVQDIRQYHQNFIDDCLKQRKRKILSFTKSIQRIMQRAQEDSRIVVKYLQSSQCKIPWAINDINEAWELAQRDLLEIRASQEQQASINSIQNHQIQDKISLGQLNQINQNMIQ